MADINLLPWRDERRKQRQRDFLGMIVGFAVLSAVIWGAVHLQINRMIDAQESRNDFLQREIALLDEKIEEIRDLEREKARLLARMRVIQDLQANRPIVVHLFDEMVKTLPDGAYLNEVERKGEAVTLRGVAESNARISAMMRSIDGSDWMADPRLNVIETSKAETVRESRFSLQAKQRGPQSAASAGGAGQ